MTAARRFATLLTLLCTVPALVCCSTAPDEIGGESREICPEGGVVGWGDSLTYGLTKADSKYERANPTWLETLGEELGVKTENFGAPSQGSAEIAIRQGGLKPTVTLSGDEIRPDTTDETAITAITPVDGWTQYKEAGTMQLHGTLAGVSGNLQHTMISGEESFSFVPDSPPESAIPVPPQSTFAGDEGTDFRSCLQIIWAGTNNSKQPSAITRDIDSMVNWIADPKRYLIIGTVPSIRDELSATYGPQFVDLQGWLMSEGLAAAGISPTRDDAQASADGDIPPSLLVDGTHFTQAAYTAIGQHLASVIKTGS